MVELIWFGFLLMFGSGLGLIIGSVVAFVLSAGNHHPGEFLMFGVGALICWWAIHVMPFNLVWEL